MRYIIDRKTNEHERYDGQNYDATKYRIVEADSEGWIPRTGSENPLPDDAWCEIKCSDNSQSKSPLMAKSWRWNDPGLKFYRPILTEKVQEPVTDAARKEMPDLVVTRDGIECADQKAALLEFKMQCLEASERGKRLAEKEAERRNKATQYDPRSVSFNLLDRLEEAHQAAAQIPDIIAQIKAKLEQYGHTVVPLSPFVAAEFVESEPAVETPQDNKYAAEW